ncbi:anthranilate synthase component I [Streptosporangium sp. NPDC000396]|uniref:anthranilate synthase component I n=1 Tax=Streptosporangium sp. NPDC000396 TaxID=3366185 RepID=UPI0036B859E6
MSPLPCGIAVHRVSERIPDAAAVQRELESALDGRRGMLAFKGSGTAVGYVDPPLELTARFDVVTVRALNARGRVLLEALHPALTKTLTRVQSTRDLVTGVAKRNREVRSEEDRTRQAGVFAVVRALVAAMHTLDDALLGLYGAFGYDLFLQVEPLELHQERDPSDRTLVLHLPDTLTEFDLRRGEAIRHHYEFSFADARTDGLPRETPEQPYRPSTAHPGRDHQPGEYAELVERALRLFRSGDLFEAVPGQAFHRGCTSRPSELFRRLRASNPSPYSLLMNLGDGEYLVGASPEMFVGVRRDQAKEDRQLIVESAPISGTIARGRDALEDAIRVRELLASGKDECELTMCTDVDRNDKAKVCLPGTVEIKARRRIEMYSTLIHTVDHVVGRLRTDRDALDAFLAHLWAVTVTGAPKLAAVQFLEREERTARRWYGGATGRIGLDGTLDTTLTLRTIQIRDGVAVVRAGATLLHESDPSLEEAETELKAMALLRALEEQRREKTGEPERKTREDEPVRVLMVDHEDSFVHCLADYFRQVGAVVTTFRAPAHLAVIETERPDLLVLSPGPGRPSDFGLGDTLRLAEGLGIPVFGVCLGLQGMVEHFGGRLGVLDRPVHGRSSRISVVNPDSALLAGLPGSFDVGRYHSLYAEARHVPDVLTVSATTDDGIAMVVEHISLPFAAVQFHPESLMTAGGSLGRRLIENVIGTFVRRPAMLGPGGTR